MLRRTLAVLMLLAAVATTIGMIPGLAENIASACDIADKSGCFPVIEQFRILL